MLPTDLTSKSRSQHFKIISTLRGELASVGGDGEVVEILDRILDEYAERKRIRAEVKCVKRGKSRFKAFAGMHVLLGGKFARRRNGQQSNWNPDIRQALYLLGDQMNRRPDSHWGKKLRANKAHFRRVHPEPVKVDGKTRYSNGHIHKMATWRTLTQFAIWLYREWSRYENDPTKFVLDPHYPAQTIQESRRKAA